MNFKILLPGHRYQMPTLDSHMIPPWRMELQFVQRCGPDYPGNIGAYPGVTLQMVLRICLNRIEYLHGQIPHPVNPIIRRLLRLCIWLLEFRASRRRGHSYWHSPTYASNADMCEICGHTDCRKQ